MLIRMKFYIKSHVRLYILCSFVYPYKHPMFIYPMFIYPVFIILCSSVFFLTSLCFIRYKVTVMVLICRFVFPSWITNAFWKLIIASILTVGSCFNNAWGEKTTSLIRFLYHAFNELSHAYKTNSYRNFVFNNFLHNWRLNTVRYNGARATYKRTRRV